MAARRRRRLDLARSPEFRWALNIAVTRGSADLPAGAPVWSLRLENDGGRATGASVVLFTDEIIVRSSTGDGGTIDAGELWELTLDGLEAQATNPVRGYALAQSADGRWHAATVDGRSASFRTQPDEIGVLRTLGLRQRPAAEPHDASVLWSERVTAETRR